MKLWAGSIAVHIFDQAFLRRCSTRAETLPYHVAHKKVPYLDPEGRLVEPDQPNAYKFERFIFDLLPFAQNAIVCEVDPADGFCALKNAAPAPAETEAHVRDAISNLHRRWLQEAGVHIADDIHVEISPLLAVDEQQVKQNFEAGSQVLEDHYFGPEYAKS